MTASALAPSTRVARPRIPYFWWLRQSKQGSAPVDAGFVPSASDNAYIPSGTADLWRSSKRHPGR